MIGLLGVPANSAGTTDGVARAPEALRRAGLLEALQDVREVHDFGDVIMPEPSPVRDPMTHIIDPAGLATLVQRVREGIARILDAGSFPLVIGGDCPLLLGCLAAAKRNASIGLMFVDGHEDAYLPEQSSTGEAADMELACALGMIDVSWSPELDGMMPLVRPTDVCVLGARDAGLLEAEGVPSLRERVSLVDVDDLAADPAATTMAAGAALTEPWWFHIDLDVLSTDALAAVDYQQPGGLGWNELAEVADTALASGPVGWDLTIYNPDLDPDRVHARRIVAFVASVLGSSGS